MKLLNITTGITAQPIYNPSATELALAASSNLLVWLEGEAAYLTDSGTVWHDRKTAKGYPVTNAALSAGAAINGNGALAFSGANYATIANGLPIISDYSILAVVRNRKTTAAGASCNFLGSPTASYFALGSIIQAGDTNFRIGTSHSGASVIAGTVDHPTNVPCLVSAYWDQTTGTQRVYLGGALETTSATGRSNSVDSTAQIGNITGLLGSRGFIGDIAAVLIFNIDFNKSANAAFAADVNAYLKTKYSV